MLLRYNNLMLNQNLKCLNIACGSSYIKQPNWVNLDYRISEGVKKANLLKKLPFKDLEFDAIYCSHFVEHIPLRKIDSFFQECFRVLRPDGVLRIVMPNYVFLCKEFIINFENKDFEKADFIKILTLDQLIRTYRGGYLKEYLVNIHNSENQDLKKYIQEIIGEDFEAMKKSSSLLDQLNISNFFRMIEILWIHSISLFLPSSFRDQNVSFASVGEKHAWLYDEESITKELEKNNFKDIFFPSFHESYFGNLFHELDIHPLNKKPRKGTHQFFIEAKK